MDLTTGPLRHHDSANLARQEKTNCKNLAVRSLEGLPLTVPSTTGVSKPVTGGRFNSKKAA